MKQQAGIGILLALTTAMCWGALPIAMKQVLEVMEPPTVVFYRFLMASIGLGAILAVKGKLPPLRIFRKPRWLVLLAIATGGLFGNFILFSSSLQYLSPTASQVIGQLSPVGMMVASVFILKEKMRGTQIIGACMLLCGLVMFFNTSLIEIFTRLTDYTWGVIFGVGAATVWVSYGVAISSSLIPMNVRKRKFFMRIIASCWDIAGLLRVSIFTSSYMRRTPAPNGAQAQI